jgi:hypothetical protein
MANKFYKISITEPVTGTVTIKRIRSLGEFTYKDEQFFLHIDLGTKSKIAVSHVETGSRAFTVDRYAGLYNLTYKPVEKSEIRLIEEAIRKFDTIPDERFKVGIERAKLALKNQKVAA